MRHPCRASFVPCFHFLVAALLLLLLLLMLLRNPQLAAARAELADRQDQLEVELECLNAAGQLL